MAVKKKAAKKKAASKKKASKKTAKKKVAKKKIAADTFLEPKLGYDPLAWISGDEDESIGGSNIVVEPEAVSQPELKEEPEVEMIVDEPAVEDNNRTDNTMLNLPDVFGIAQAEIMHEEINNLLPSVDEIKIDGSAVESVDTSALQLLVALVNECKEQGKKVSWQEKSDKINDSAKLLNLTESLNL